MSKKPGPPKGSKAPPRAFKKGQSGNPKGRPKKGESFRDIISELCGMVDIKLPDGKKISRKQAVAEKLFAKAIHDGDVSAIRFIVEKMDGKAPLVVQGPDDEDGEPTPVVVVVQKRSIKEWQKEYNQSGSHSPVKPKRSPAPRSRSSSAARKAEGNPTT